MLVILAAILVHVALILYLQITKTKHTNRLRRLRGEIPSQHSDTYDDTLSFPESVQQSSLQNSDTRDTGVMTTCNGAYADTSDGKRSHSSFTSNTDHSKAKGADDDPDYENLVCSYHLFGDNVQPELVTTPNSAKVGRTFKNVAYSEPKDYPHSGNVATSRSPSNIHEEDQFEPSKQRSREKAERFK